MNLTAIEDALRGWLVNATGWSVIFANQAGPRPSLPYCTIKVYSTTPVGLKDEERDVDANGIMTLRKIRQLAVSIQFFGEGARAKAEDALSSLSKPTVLDDLRSSGIAVYDVGTVNDLTALQETKWEERAQFDLTIGVGEDMTDDTGAIEQVEVNGRFERPDGTFTNRPITIG